jgi:hypothetical protein
MKQKYYLVISASETDGHHLRASSPWRDSKARVWSQILSSKGSEFSLFVPYRTKTPEVEELVRQIRADHDVIGKVRVVLNSHY